MANLIPCPACGRQVSNQAKACIQCGQPLGVTAGVVTIEKTAKKWKSVQAIGLGTSGVATLLLAVGGSQDIGGAMEVGACLFACGVIVAIGGTILAWWHHG